MRFADPFPNFLGSMYIIEELNFKAILSITKTYVDFRSRNIHYLTKAILFEIFHYTYFFCFCF